MNAFDLTNILTKEPNHLTIGDRWAWQLSNLTAYDPLLYTLTYNAIKEGDGTINFAISAVTSGSIFLIEVDSSTTAAFTAGDYIWNSFITRNSDSQRILLKTGRWTLAPNLATSTLDPRSDTKKALDAIKAVINGRASIDQSSYSIMGRSLSRMTPEELISLKTELSKTYQIELRDERRRLGKKSRRNIYTHFC